MRPSVHNTDRATRSDLPERQEVACSVRDAARFWEKVKRTDGCWLWTASVIGKHRYGQFTVTVSPGRQVHLYAHRVAWALRRGPIPDGLSVLHRCDVPTCVRPDHLFLGTQLDNMRDAAGKRRLSIPRRRNRIHKSVVIERYLAGGVTMRQLAAEYGVHKLTVHRWLKGHKAPYQRGRKAA